MTPVFANSAWVGGPERLILRGGRWRKRTLRVRYGVFVHPKAGPVLIDTGYTAHSVSAPGRSGWLSAYGWALAPELIEAAQPGPMLERFGLRPEDIAVVIITHFHVDHISGLKAYPNARFLCSGAAWNSLQGNTRFQNIRHGMFSELLPDDFAARMSVIDACPLTPVPGLPDGYDLFGDGSILAIPLPGHAPGHIGLVFPRPEGPLLYATDAQWLLDALPRDRRPGLAPRLIADDAGAMGQSADLVEAFRRAGGEVMLCHDDTLTPYDVENGARL